MTATGARSSKPSRDRRTQRTRAALLDAFRDLVLKDGYDAVTPTRLAGAANVGRSTFYEHFANVDEVLAFSMARLIAPLAASATKPAADPAATGIVQHFWDNRKMAKAMLAGGGHKVVAGIFTEQVEVGLASLRTGIGTGASTAAAKVTARFIVAGSLCVLEEWLSGRASGSAAEIAAALHSAGYAAALALNTDGRTAAP